MLERLCREHTQLGDAEIALLETVAGNLALMADLTGADVFIDCLLPDGNTAVVVAQAKPLSENGSAYVGNVVGKAALASNEPAVFHAFRTGMPVRDLKAITQENVSVKQDVAPIKNKEGRVVGVLIKEKDVSGYLLQDRKYEELARGRGRVQQEQAGGSDQQLMLREVHHRIKNNLQTIASILNMQARKSGDPQMKAAFRENVSRVQSIAAIHDLLTTGESGSEVEIKSLLERIRRSIQSMQTREEPPAITVEGDALWLAADKASALALCANELTMNAAEHAFCGQGGGSIRILLQSGTLYSTLTVLDNGCGFDPERVTGSMGLSIVRSLVKETLGGELRLLSDRDGTRAMLEFKK